MRGETHVGELALESGPSIDDRLSPAEAHRIVRQKLTRLTGPLGLAATDLSRLARQMRGRTYQAGEIIVPRGARADCLGLLVRGQVAVHVGRGGATRLVVVLLPGSTFGEGMLSVGHPSSATLQALTRSEVRFLRRAAVKALDDERRVERQTALLWQMVGAGAALLAVMLCLVLAVSLPASRQVLAALPMSVGQWCIEQGYEQCAGEAWQVAANLAPEDPNPLLALGAFQFQRGETAAAEQSFAAAQALAPDLPEAYNNLGLIYARQGQHEQAIAAFDQALALEPGIAATEHNLGLSLQAMKAYDEAIVHYQAALALSEPQTSTLVNLAVAYYETGDPIKAADAAREALLYDDSLAPAYAVLGAVALESRRPKKALADLSRAVALDAGYGQAYFYLGLAYKSLNQPEEAISAFERALNSADDELTRVRIRRHLNELYEVERQGGVH